MPETSKAQERHLRDLAARAYDREFSVALRDLHGHFLRWQAEEITAWDLNELVHEHHSGISRQLYSVYTGSDPSMPVARALVRQFLRWEEEPRLLSELWKRKPVAVRLRPTTRWSRRASLVSILQR